MSDNPEHHTDLPVGEILRRARLAFGRSLADVEHDLRIRAAQLQAIEEGRNDLLPGRVYAIGFVRTYAEYLGLDGDKIIHLYKTQSGGGGRVSLNFPISASDSRLPGVSLIAASLCGLLLLGLVWNIAGRVPPDRPVLEIPQVPEELKDGLVLLPDESAPEDPPGLVQADEEDVIATTIMEDRVTIEILERSWVEIRNADGRALLSRILQPGDRYSVPDEIGLVLSTGNAGGLRILVDGEPITPIGASGEVRRNVRLNPDLLKTIENHGQ